MRSRPVAVLLIICVVVCSAAAQEQSLINFLTADEGAEFRKLEIAVRRSFANRGFQKGLDALRGQMEILETAGKREGAGRAFLDEASKVNWYNQACCLSRLGEKAEAVKTLARAVDLGFTSVEKIRADPDLDGIRNEVSFKALLAGILFNDAFAVFVPKALAVVGAKPTPLLLVLHEGEGNEKDCLARYRDLATRRGAILTAPRAPIFRSKGRYVWRNMTAVGTEKAALRKSGK